METIFLACFVFGALFTLASVALGFAGHGAAHFGHSPAHFGHGEGGAAHAEHARSAPLGHGVEHGHGVHAEVPHSDQTTFPWMNASSVIGALTWFGAAGYLMLRLGDVAVPAGIMAA